MVKLIIAITKFKTKFKRDNSTPNKKKLLKNGFRMKHFSYLISEISCQLVYQKFVRLRSDVKYYNKKKITRILFYFYETSR